MSVALTSAALQRTPITVLNQASALKTANGNTSDLVVGPYSELLILINVTSNQGTTPTVQFFVDTKGPDNVYYPIWQSTTVSTSTAQAITSIGAGCTTNASFGSTVRLRWVIGGSASPGYTFSASITGK